MLHASSEQDTDQSAWTNLSCCSIANIFSLDTSQPPDRADVLASYLQRLRIAMVWVKHSTDPGKLGAQSSGQTVMTKAMTKRYSVSTQSSAWLPFIMVHASFDTTQDKAFRKTPTRLTLTIRTWTAALWKELNMYSHWLLSFKPSTRKVNETL